MRRLFQFIYQYRAFFIFLLLEVLSGWMIVYNNHYQSAAFFNSANGFSGGVMTFTYNVDTYFSLDEVNERLARENEMLRNQLAAKGANTDSLILFTPASIAGQYEYTTAEVINNSVDRFTNYLTINKGSEDGIVSGMGIVNDQGLVGKVKSVSKNYATVYSALHINFLISSLIEETQTFCTASWDGTDPTSIDLLYVPRHIKVQRGMRIVTSGYNAVFPEGVKIGTISEVSIDDDATFYDIKVELAVDFQSVNYVYSIGNKLVQEKDSLEQEIKVINE